MAWHGGDELHLRDSAHGFDGTMPSNLITTVVVVGTREPIYHNPLAEEQSEDDMVDSPGIGSGPPVEDVQMGVTRGTHHDGCGPPERADTQTLKGRPAPPPPPPPPPPLHQQVRRVAVRVTAPGT